MQHESLACVYNLIVKTRQDPARPLTYVASTLRAAQVLARTALQATFAAPEDPTRVRLLSALAPALAACPSAVSLD
eukprot:1259024-Pyramimonas_sp.AAC.2